VRGNGADVLGATNALRRGEARSSSERARYPDGPRGSRYKLRRSMKQETAEAIGNSETVFPTP
jgi:hypothetical protein